VLSPKQTLYGLDLVTDRAIVVEGPADAWAVGPGAVATFGCTFSLTQVRLLSTLKIRVIAYDRDAQAQAHKLANALLAFPGKTYVVQLSAKDPAECPKDEIKRLRDLCQLT
jgi:DNA primase